MFALRLFGRSSIGRYALIGVSGVAIDFSLFAILIALDANPQIATLVSTPFGILNNFFWNSKLNFMSRLAIKRAVLFCGIGLVGVFISYHFVGFLTLSGVSPLLSKTIAIPTVATIQFIANKFLTFGRFAQ